MINNLVKISKYSLIKGIFFICQDYRYHSSIVVNNEVRMSMVILLCILVYLLCLIYNEMLISFNFAFF
jgi:hypothetical protein